MTNTATAELIFIPLPMIGHMKPAIQIAKLLVNRHHRLTITIILIKPPPGFPSAYAIANYIDSLADKPAERIRFIKLPQDDTLPTLDPKSPLPFINDFIHSRRKYVTNVVAGMMGQPDFGRLSGFVIDWMCTAIMDVAGDFNVPAYVFYSSGAAYLGLQLHIQTLCDDGYIQDVVELSKSDSRISVPTFVKPVPTKVFPSGFDTKEGVDFVLLNSRKLREAKAILVNTLYELETHAIDSLSVDKNVPTVYPVGPILNSVSADGGENSDGDDVLRWLDKQPCSSVVFLCFGSMGSFEEVQLKEIAYALERSGHRFLWSLRQHPSPEQKSRNSGEFDDPGAVLPEGFLERTGGIGKVTGWAPQVEVLGHKAVGGFVSHCGWNSVLESLWFGVPMAAWPIYAEQQMNAFEMVVELGLAVEIRVDYKKDMFNPKDDDMVSSKEIEIGIRKLMEDKEVRERVEAMGKMSRAAMEEGGSSYASVGHFVQDFVGNIS